MEVLKTILRRSIRKQAIKVAIVMGQEPRATCNDETITIDLDQSIDLETMDSIFRFLFPKDYESTKKGAPIQGALKVPNIGTIHVIGHYPGDVTLYVPPKGDAIFKTDWEVASAISSGELTSSGARTAEDTNAENTAFSSEPNPSEETAERGSAPPIEEEEVVQASRDLEAQDRGEEPSEPGQFAGPMTDASETFARGLSSEPTGEFKIGIQARVKSQDHERPLPGPTTEGDDADQDAEIVANFAVRRDPAPTESEPPEAETEADDDSLAMAFVPTLTKPKADVLPPTHRRSDSEPFPHEGSDEPTIARGYDHHDLGERTAAAPGFRQLGEPTPEGPIKVNFGVNREAEGYVSDGFNAIDELLKMMVDKHASDLHLTCQQPICLRVDGDIRRADSSPIDKDRMESLLAPIIPPFNMAQLAKDNDTDFAYEVRDIGRFRINVFRDRFGVGAVLRHVPAKIMTAAELQLPAAIYELCKLSKGLVLVTGPTGSGKSTTLAAMVNEINRSRQEHIITIEDPIEFIHPQLQCLVNQREVHRHTRSFSAALRAALREDPDVILIGELRDLETIETAIETAETGHLVFGTLHTTTATSTVDRVIDMFPHEQQEQVRQMLSSSLKGVVTQSLLKKKSGGRVAAHEILIVNEAVSAMMREGKTHMLANHMQTQKSAGNQLLNESLLKLVRDDIVNPLEAYAKCVDKRGFADMLRRAGFQIKLEATPGNVQTGPASPTPARGGYRGTA